MFPPVSGGVSALRDIGGGDSSDLHAHVNTLEKESAHLVGRCGSDCPHARNTVQRVCEQYGGDRAAVILTGFSRGAIGCNYLGLHDEGRQPLARVHPL